MVRLGERFYKRDIRNKIVISLFQGLCVAVLFCFCNGEVRFHDYESDRFSTYLPNGV